MESNMDKRMKEVRQEYITELFHMKNKFEKRTKKGDEDSKTAAYKDLME